MRQTLQKDIVNGLQLCLVDNKDVLISHVIHDTLEYLKANLFYHNIGLPLQIFEIAENQNANAVKQKMSKELITTTDTANFTNVKANAAFFQNVTDFLIYMSINTEKDKDAETTKRKEIIQS